MAPGGNGVILIEQKKDALFKEITNYLENGVFSEENQDRTWAKEIDLYDISGGLLCRLNEPISKKRPLLPQHQVVFPIA